MEQKRAEMSLPKGTFAVLWVWTAAAAALIALGLEQQTSVDPLRVYAFTGFPVVVAVAWIYLGQSAVVRSALASFGGALIGTSVGVWPAFAIGFSAPTAPDWIGVVMLVAYGTCVAYAAFSVWSHSAFGFKHRVAVLIAGLVCLAVGVSSSLRGADFIGSAMAAGFALVVAVTFMVATRILNDYRAA